MKGYELLFPPSQSFALQRLEQFLDSAGVHYTHQRNYDLGPEQRTTSSLLSPYIKHRVLSERFIVEKVLAKHSYESAEKFLQEICWRTYWKGWLQMRPSVWSDFRMQVDTIQESLSKDTALEQAYQKAIAGQTGIECFDSWIQELKQYGYLHNHARMWFASIWVFTLELPWQLGAEFFYFHLFDADAASNTLSWRWVAGLQTKGKHYLATASNIKRFTDGRFDPVKHLNEDASSIVSTTELPPAMPLEMRSDTPRQPFVLVVHEEDLSFNKAILDDPLCKGIYLQKLTKELACFRSPKVTEFVDALIENQVSNVRVDYEVCLSEEYCLDDFCTQQQVDVAVVYQPHQGYLNDVFQQALSSELSIFLIHQSWDKDLFPNATAGYFRFKKNLKSYLTNE